jgi:CHAD domain-containing protein
VAAFEPIQTWVAEVRRLEPLARAGDADAVHDMRVAIRRLRTVLWALADVFPAALQVLDGELRWVGRVLGEVRDLDVQLERFRKRVGRDPDLGPLLPLLENRRREAGERLIDSFGSERFAQTMHALTATATGAAIPGGATGGDALARALKEAKTRAAKLKVGGPETDFHRLRKGAKRLRYVLEALRPLYGSRSSDAIDRLKVLQEIVGKFQDLVTERQTLAPLLRWPDLTPNTVHAGERRLRKLHLKIKKREAQVVDAVADLEGSAWDWVDQA